MIYLYIQSTIRYLVSAKGIIKSAYDQDMISVRSRSGVGILATLILMFSIVMFVGSLFWLMTAPGFLMGDTGLSLFKPATMPDDIPTKPNNNIESLSEEPEIVENPSLEEALSDLIRDGCHIINVKTKVYLDNPQNVSYKEFKTKALETQIVVASPSDSGTFLLVQIKSIQWVWIPS